LDRFNIHFLDVFWGINNQDKQELRAKTKKAIGQHIKKVSLAALLLLSSSYHQTTTV